MATSTRYTSVRGGGRALARLAPVVQMAPLKITDLLNGKGQ